MDTAIARKVIRRILEIEPDVELLLTVQDDQLLLRTRRQALRAVRKRIAGLVPPGVSRADELIRERRREAANDD